jgi:hypothetical protein
MIPGLCEVIQYILSRLAAPGRGLFVVWVVVYPRFGLLRAYRFAVLERNIRFVTNSQIAERKIGDQQGAGYRGIDAT